MLRALCPLRAPSARGAEAFIHDQEGEVIDEKRLAEIEARAATLAPLPWNPGDGGHGPFGVRDRTGALMADIPQPLEEGQRLSEFIAHAREDVPALVAEVRRLRGVLVRMGEIVSRMATINPCCPVCVALVDAVKDSTEGRK